MREKTSECARPYELITDQLSASAMPVQLKIELPDSAPAALQSSPEALAHELRLAAAVKWFELGKVSQGKAAELAGLSRAEFLDALVRYDVSPFQLSPEDLAQEMMDDQNPEHE